MKASFTKADLLEAVNKVSRAVPVRTSNDIMQCILFEVESGHINLIASTGELSIKTVTDGEIMEGGSAAIDAGIITDIIKKCESPESRIVIDCDPMYSYQVTVEAENSTFRFPGRDGEEFPYPQYVEKDSYISLSQFSLKEAVRQTAFSSGLNENNKMMGGAHFEVDGARLRITTLDGYRVAIRNIELKDDYSTISSIIPVRSLNEISKIIPADNDKEVIIYFTDNYVCFEWDETTVTSRVIDGSFFNLTHMIKSDYDTKVMINKNELIREIDKSMVFVRENEHKPLIFTITMENVNVRIRGSFGEMEADAECDTLGRDIKIGFNPKLMLDALRVIDDEEVSLYFTNAKAPCFIRDDKESYIYMVLPMNFNE